MICKYCNCSTVYVPLAYVKHERMRALSVYYCKPCLAEYVCFSQSGNLWNSHLYTVINNKLYRWSVSPNIQGGTLWYVGSPGVPGKRPNEGLVKLKELSDQVSLTPSNINEKISTFLPFI
jgi:hypothetical protein